MNICLLPIKNFQRKKFWEFELKSSNSALNEKSILKEEISNTCDHEIGVQNFNSQRANVKSSSLHTSHDIKCFYCCKLGHIAYNCPLKRKSYYGPKMKWIPKETKPSNVSHANPQESKHVLIPKNSHFKRNVRKDKNQTIFIKRKQKSFASHSNHWNHFEQKVS